MPKQARKSSKLCKENIDAIAALIKKGVPKGSAAAMVGIHRITFWKWLAAAEQMEDRPPKNHKERMLIYARSAIATARAELLQRLIAHVQVVGKDDWRSSAWILERRYPDEFGDKTNITASIIGGKSPMRIAVEKLSEYIENNEGSTNA